MEQAASKGSEGLLACGAWVMPNMPIAPDTPLESFLVPLTDLETVSGAKPMQPHECLGSCLSHTACSKACRPRLLTSLYLSRAQILPEHTGQQGLPFSAGHCGKSLSLLMQC